MLTDSCVQTSQKKVADVLQGQRSSGGEGIPTAYGLGFRAVKVRTMSFPEP